jgi:hypothetical protein|tara:strand:+ start:710 stop:1078 length:369 start_codon:yes stop_codon:yes gene_type:complete
MVQQRSRQESLADEKQREKNEKNKLKEGLKGDTIDKLRKFLEKNSPSDIQRLGPYRPPSWFRGINPKFLPENLEKRYKDLEKKFARKKINKKRAISDKEMANAKGGKIKVYAKGGGVRKPSY